MRETLKLLLHTDKQQYELVRRNLNDVFWDYVNSIGGLKTFIDTERENGIDFSFIDFYKHDNYAFTCFDGAVFDHYVYFMNASFHETVTFRSVFNKVVQFDGAIFYGTADFDGASFGGLTSFTAVQFRGSCSFREVAFPEHNVGFSDAVFEKVADFRGIVCGHMGIESAKFNDLLLLSGTRNSTINDIDLAANLYRIAKNTAQSHGDIERASQYHYDYWQTVTRNKIRINAWKTWKIWNPICALIGYYLFGSVLFGFGEKWHRQVIAAVLVVLVCAGLFRYFDGIENGVNSFGTCIYFSIVTFTTLGYGDLRPTVEMRWLAATEAVTGMMLMAMLVVSLARKFTR